MPMVHHLRSDQLVFSDGLKVDCDDLRRGDPGGPSVSGSNGDVDTAGLQKHQCVIEGEGDRQTAAATRDNGVL